MRTFETWTSLLLASDKNYEYFRLEMSNTSSKVITVKNNDSCKRLLFDAGKEQS